MANDRRPLTSPSNGRKSRGPTTPQGKAASAGHNLRHGILARNIVLDEESMPRFHALAAEFHTQLQPRDLAETTLVEDLIANRWRQFRLWGIEKANLSLEMQKLAPGLGDISKLARAALAFRSLGEQTRSLDIINRYQTRIERQFRRDFQLYLHLRNRETVIFPFEPTVLPDPDSSALDPTCVEPTA